MTKIDRHAEIAEPVFAVVSAGPELYAVKWMEGVRGPHTVAAQRMIALAVQTAPVSLLGFTIAADTLVSQAILLQNFEKKVISFA